MPVVSSRRLTWLGYYSLLLVGIYITALGPGLPGLAARAHVSLSQAGTLLTALFGGGLVAAITAGRAMDRFGRRPLLVAGSLVNGLGCLMLALSITWPQTLASGVLMGIGDSSLIVAYHVLFGDLHRDAAGAALNRLNVFFGVGALAGPVLAGLSIHAAGDLRYVLVLVALGQGLAALLLLRSAFPPLPAAPGDGAQYGLQQLIRLPLLWLLGAMLFLYVMLEVGLGSWTYTYLRLNGGVGVAAASLLTSGYWVGLTLGRVLSPLALRRVSDVTLLAMVSAGTTVAAMMLITAGSWRPGGAVSILLLGLVLGPIWPLTFAVATGVYQHGAGAASGLLTSAGSVGGVVGPWLQGVLLLQYGFRPGLALPLAGSAGMLLIAVVIRHRLYASARLELAHQ